MSLPQGGFTKIKFSKVSKHVIFASSTDGDLVQLDARDGQVTKTFKGHVGAINDFVEVQGQDGTWYVATAGDDSFVNLYKIER